MSARRLGAALLAALLALGAVPALALTGQTYDAFETRYSENLNFINDNVGRHLLPLVFSYTSGAEAAEQTYRLQSDVLLVSVTVETLSQIIESCLIQLTAPEGLSYGTAAYNDFANAGYHSYALLMAMDAGDAAVDRYALVTDVEAGLAQTGDYTRTVGAYTLHGLRIDNTVLLEFANNGLPQSGATDGAAAGGASDGGVPGDGVPGDDLDGPVG